MVGHIITLAILLEKSLIRNFRIINQITAEFGDVVVY